MSLGSRLDRLETAAGVGKKPIAVLVLNDGETAAQAWRRMCPNTAYPSEEERAEQYAGFIIIDLN